jgi:hypothetical protein
MMPRLSLWKTEKSHDYRFFDKTIREMFQVGSTDLYIHKYTGTNNPATVIDKSLPNYEETTVTNIQDLLFLENRDRKYDKNIYRLRGHYNVQNLDFDLSQFGLFLSNDTIFVTIHYNDMIDVIGRKLMVGDVFELPHLTDYHPLDEKIPIGLRRYYQITDANFASEGFSPTWYPHLWRIKCEPLVNTQEFSDILSQPVSKDNYMGDYDPTKTYPVGYTITQDGKIYTPKKLVPPGVKPPDAEYWEEVPNSSLADLISTYKKNLEINDIIKDEAKRLVPKLGYDRSQLYVVPTYSNGEPASPTFLTIDATPPISVGNIEILSTSNYPTPSPVLRIYREYLNTTGIGPGYSIILGTAYLEPDRTDTNSGPVDGTLVATACSIGYMPGPFGSTDATNSSADQYASFTVTVDTPAKLNTQTIKLLSVPADLTPGLKIKASIINANNQEIQIFPDNTVINSINSATRQIVVSNKTLTGIPSGTAILIASNFDGVITSQMNYHADSDPRFRYIRRVSPRGFGYIAGYNSGDETAPNGEPVRAGTSFPANPEEGDYYLRIDYLPQKLYRYGGTSWVEISRNVRTASDLSIDDESQLSTFINNTSTITTSTGLTIPSRQSLSQALKIKAD